MLNDLAQLYRVIGNTTLAIECFRRSLLALPEDHTTLQNVINLCFRLVRPHNDRSRSANTGTRRLI